ncbi:hypothetical protein [Kutzneria buriramensis]|uniref:Peptidase inhibitor family I36 n=1 Tax=Kutzneria buriramensis TaxID=1045776 RepID=A0A3E0HUV3_9PSEU|nr:hypothetical protein [Kutzneria buriramensis]REH50060.1 hypothetical protein BCF44_104328 [Kutzneria buriramensis]
MANGKAKRIATAALAAAAVIGGGIAMAAPASAATYVTDCPARPNWSRGVELWEHTGANTCFADDGTGWARARTWIPNVQDVTSGWNFAYIYVVGDPNPYNIKPNQSLHLSDTGVTVNAVYIYG